MKVIYLDQLHWIALSQAAYGLESPPEVARVLDILRQAQALGRACFPLSYAHYRETWKRRNAEQRLRLAKFMLELSDGITVAPPDVVIAHEIEIALAHYFPDRVIPEPFKLLGHGWMHAYNDGHVSLRPAIEAFLGPEAELSYLCGDQPSHGPLVDLTVEQRFKKDLELWAGAKCQFSAKELKQEIYATNFSDIESDLQEALTRYHISHDEFDQLGELRHQAFLEDMPWQKAEMHLKKQWAKNRNLEPCDSDLIDWGALSLAVSYCDIVVTEKQKADLFSRDSRRFKTGATVITKLRQLPELVV
jgi:hypothetical protein